MLDLKDEKSLDWEEQIKVPLSKVSKAAGLLKHDKPFLPGETHRTLYTGIIEPHFCYCCFVWECFGVTEINQRLISCNSCRTVQPKL